MLQNRKKQEKLQRDRRKKDLLALTLVGHGHHSDSGREGNWKLKMLTHEHDNNEKMHHGKRGMISRSDSSDNIASGGKHHHVPPPPPYSHHDLAGVHGGHYGEQHLKPKHLLSPTGGSGDPKTALARIDGTNKMGLKREETSHKLERVHKVEQTTVRTVITTSEKIHNTNTDNNGQAERSTKHLPAIHSGASRRESDGAHGLDHGHHGGGQLGHGGRKTSMSGGSDSGTSKFKMTGIKSQFNHDCNPSIKGGKSSSGGGASHLKSLLRQDSGDKLNSRNDEKKKTDMLRMRMKEKEKQQRRVNQDKKDKSRNTNNTKMGGGAKKKK